MDNKIKAFLKKYFIAVLSLTLIIAVGFTVYAEFTKSQKAKRVVAAYSSSEMKFSSNYMRPFTDDSEKNYRTIYVSPEDAEAIKNGAVRYGSAVITVCNFVQGNPNQPFGSNIVYELTGRLVTINSSGVVSGYTGGKTVTVADVTVDPTAAGSTVSASASYSSGAKTLIAAATGTTHEYKVTFPGDLLYADEKVYLELTASLDTLYPDLPGSLRVYIDIAERPEAVYSGWEVIATDQRTGASPSDFYGYNYRLTGTGSGTAVISWNNTKLKISDAFLSSVSTEEDPVTVTTSGTTSSITLSVDSETQNNYDIQFYPVSRNNINEWTWNDVVVTLTYTE